MTILNFGSMNIDYSYTVSDLVKPGETIMAHNMDSSPGGKGLNQSIAASRAGGHVSHAGMIGKGGVFLKDFLKEQKVDTAHIEMCEEIQGHAVIQVDRYGNNCIIVYGGSNKKLTEDFIINTLDQFTSDTMVIMQNEVNYIGRIAYESKRRGMSVVVNPSPVNSVMDDLDINHVDWLVLNEIEADAIFGTSDIGQLPGLIRKKQPGLSVVLTVGSRGAYCFADGNTYTHGIYDVPVVDTTGAGDTFMGYFVVGLSHGLKIPGILKRASIASSLCVSRSGAAVSIPELKQVLEAEVVLKLKNIKGVE